MNELIPPPEETKAPVEAPKIRPRHYELALAEQAMRRANGRHLGIDEILHRNGFAVDNKDKAAKRGSAQEDLTMQSLRLYVSAAQQAAMGLSLLELRKGVLRIAVGDRLDDADLLHIIEALQHANHEILRTEVEPWDRAELARMMR